MTSTTSFTSQGANFTDANSFFANASSSTSIGTASVLTVFYNVQPASGFVFSDPSSSSSSAAAAATITSTTAPTAFNPSGTPLSAFSSQFATTSRNNATVSGTSPSAATAVSSAAMASSSQDSAGSPVFASESTVNAWKAKAMAATIVAILELVILLGVIGYWFWRRKRGNGSSSGSAWGIMDARYAQIGGNDGDNNSDSSGGRIASGSKKKKFINPFSDRNALRRNSDTSFDGQGEGTMREVSNSSRTKVSPGPYSLSQSSASLSKPESTRTLSTAPPSAAVFAPPPSIASSQQTSSSKLTAGMAGVGKGLAALDPTPYNPNAPRPISVADSRSSLSTYQETDEYTRDPFQTEYNPISSNKPFDYRVRASLESGGTSLYPSGPESEYSDETETGTTTGGNRTSMSTSLGRSGSASTTRSNVTGIRSDSRTSTIEEEGSDGLRW